jgi:hypothetical protein
MFVSMDPTTALAGSIGEIIEVYGAAGARHLCVE